MATPDAPLLDGREAAPLLNRVLSSIQSRVDLEFLAKMADGVIVTSLPATFYLLASPSSVSPCRKDVDFLKAMALVVPLSLLMPGVILTSPLLRAILGSERPRAHWPTELLLGAVLATWTSVCVFCASSPPLVLLVALLALVAGVFWGYRSLAMEDATA